jgi:hypothetical protein
MISRLVFLDLYHNRLDHISGRERISKKTRLCAVAAYLSEEGTTTRTVKFPVYFTFNNFLLYFNPCRAGAPHQP